MTENNKEIILQEEPSGHSTDIWKTLSFSRETLIGLALSVFLLQPLIQLFMRFIERAKVSRLQYPDLTRYETSIDATHKIMIIVTAAMFLSLFAFAVYSRLNPDAVPAAHRISLLNRETTHRLVPFFLFVLFSVGILLSTIIRGPGSYDIHGHWYMHESIYSYIIYALAYFFCATLLWSNKARKILLFVLVGTALPLHLLILVDQWGTPISYFVAKGLGTVGLTAVFFNSNHYGYYIMVSLLTSALLFAYEKRTGLRILCAICGIVSSIVLIINNTLGAYLASLFVLILFVIYSFLLDRTHLKQAFIILGGFLLITFLMSFHYNTILSSILVLSNDIEMIITDPLEADSGGSGRWRLWKGTVQHLPEHPLVGFGVEGLLDLYGIGTPHNEFLQYAAFFGIPVMLYYIAACAVVLWRVFRHHRQMSDSTMVCFFVTIGYLASSFFGVTIFYTTPFLYILLGMTYAEYLKNGKQHSEASNTVSSTGMAEESDTVPFTDTTEESDSAPSIGMAEESDTVPSAGIECEPTAPARQPIADGKGQIHVTETEPFPVTDQTIQIEKAREQGYTEGLAQGQKDGAELLQISLVCKKMKKQKTLEQIAEDLEEDVSSISYIFEAAKEAAPDYDTAAVFHRLHP